MSWCFSFQKLSLDEKCPYSELFWSTFSGLNTERYSVSLRIHSKCEKMQTRITPNTDTFYAVCIIPFFNISWLSWSNNTVFARFIWVDKGIEFWVIFKIKGISYLCLTDFSIIGWFLIFFRVFLEKLKMSCYCKTLWFSLGWSGFFLSQDVVEEIPIHLCWGLLLSRNRILTLYSHLAWSERRLSFWKGCWLSWDDFFCKLVKLLSDFW